MNTTYVRTARSMRRFAWCTDIHLNFAKPNALSEFLHRLRAAEPDLVLLGGDIAEATDVVHYLELLDRQLERPVYFVLGNHDFYFGSIRGVRDDVRALCARRSHLVYLTDAGVIELTERAALVGHDGWADARIGNYERSMIMMNDYKLIQELAGVNKEQRWPLAPSPGRRSGRGHSPGVASGTGAVRIRVPAHARAAAARSVLVQWCHFQ